MSRYAPIRTPARKLIGTPTPIGGTPLYHLPEEEHGQKFDVPVQLEGLPELKPEDHQYFGKLLKEVSAFFPIPPLQTLLRPFVQKLWLLASKTPT